MWSRIALITSNVFVFALFAWILLASRRPLCIDSRLVDKIDIITAKGSETVYACHMRKSVAFSPYLNEMLPYIKNRIHDVESALKAVGPLQQPVQIEIQLNNPWVFSVYDHSITIGEQLFLSEGHLEKAIFKAWYREREPENFAYSRLVEESITDFLLFLSKSEINIEDRYIGFRTKSGGIHWPQVIKTAQSYCNSPWKNSEHYQICISKKNIDSLLSDDLMELSLRPLVTSSLIDSYLQLPFGEKNEMIKGLSRFVTSKRDPPLNLIGAMWESHPSPIMMTREILKEMQEYMFRSSETKFSPSYKKLVSHFSESLRKKGFQDASSEVYFDFIYESDKPLDKSSSVFKQFQQISEAHKDLQIALVDGKNIWFMPSGDAMDQSLFSQVRAHSRIVEKCGVFDFAYVLSYANSAEKLMVLDSCKKKVPENLKSFIDEGPEGFARSNKDISFVQFHIPSLMIKSDMIPPKENVIALIQNRDVNSPVLQALGWQELQWEKKIDAYRPKAQIEAIQWFRF
jgi:hypothetical protein